MPEGPFGGPRPAASASPALKAKKEELEGSLGEINDRFDLTRNMLNRTFPHNDIDHPELVEVRGAIKEVKILAEIRSAKIVVVFKDRTSGEVFGKVYEYFMSIAPESTTLEAV